MYQDSKGTLLHIEDVVKLHDEREAIIMTKEEDGTILVNPINAGEPLQVDPATTTLIFSVIGETAKLQTVEELQALLLNVEKYASSQVVRKTKEKKEKAPGKVLPVMTKLDVSF